MTNELDRAIATINRHLLYSKLCTVFIQNGNVKSCLQMMGIDLDNADEEPTEQINTQFSQQSETPFPDNTETSSSPMETDMEPPQSEPQEQLQTETELNNEPTPPSTEKPKRRGRKKKKEVQNNQDEFDEAYKKAYSEAMKDDGNGQTNG